MQTHDPRVSSLALPQGMRDLLPPVASARRAVARVVLDCFTRWGYELVIPPAYEREESVVRGLSPQARANLQRFTDPASADTVVLRPDMTPQIARIAAGRLTSRHAPLRLTYEGSILRAPQGRTRGQRQISQAGIELIGWASRDADLEVISAVLEALTGAGLRGLRLELSHAGATHALLTMLEPSLRPAVVQALSQRDVSWLSETLPDEPIRAAFLLAIASAGGRDRLLQATLHPQLSGPAIEVQEAIAALTARFPDVELLCDLGETRGHGYYTGLSFVVLCDDLGQPLASGGRYDGLLREYGRDEPATGAAIDLEHTFDVLTRQAPSGPSDRILLLGSGASRASIARQLRAHGCAVAEADPMSREHALAALESERFSRVWRCADDHVVDEVSGAVVTMEAAR
ncbi:MAG: ATP phosphoribosyltransferase regulatory subunit [Deltaproteobacteria bacterium]|nr:ATP phosphoribosyltransferase regulatory subunit [Deltaproteobacteria bacterium]